MTTYPEITGIAVALPGADSPAALLRPAPAGAAAPDPAALIGRKGLRFKDRATQLGLHLAYAALVDGGLLPEGAPGTARAEGGDRIGVVVSSNLGNIDTVCRAVETIAKETTGGLSPMDTPNASSNIIASETAIRYGLRGPNLTVCSGAGAGLDAVRWASLLLRSGRADHMLVIGVEPDNEFTRALTGGPVADGGAALVLSAPGGGAGPVRALLGPVVRGPASAQVSETAGALPLEGWGELSGALGVVQCAAAAGHFAAGGTEPVPAVCGGAGTVLYAPGAGARP